MTATTERCPGCHGSGIEMSGVTYAGMSEYVGCHECGPGCPDDCGCRVGPERHESVAPRHLGATQSPDGSQGATEGLRGSENAVTDAEAARWGALADAATEGPWVVDSDGSIGAPMARLVCGEDGHPHLDCPDCGLRVGGSNSDDTAFIALARTAVPRLLADRERLKGEASRVPVLLADKAALMGDVDRLTAERDGARLMRVIATRAFETTRRVLQEASGLPDDIDDPDCRDEMVLALRPRAEKAEAEVARLRAGIEERVVGWSSYRTDPASLTAASCAESLRRLLTPPDAQEPAQEPRTGAGGPGVPDEGCEAVSGQQQGVVEAPQDGGE